MKTCLRITTVALALMMLMSVFVACAKPNEGTDTTASDTTAAPSDNNTTAAEETGVKYVADNLPSDLNFQNQTFNILAWEQSTPEYDYDKLEGKDVEDAIYKRNLKVEERLGVNLNYIIIPGNSSKMNDYCKTATTAVTAHTYEYDAFACYLRSAGSLTMSQVLYDMSDNKYLDFDMPWWPQSLISMNTIDNKLFFASGDIAQSMIYQMFFMICNKNLLTEYGLEDPQQIAIDGKWTIDKLISMASGVYSDLNNSGTKDAGDRFGLATCVHNSLDTYYCGSDRSYVTTDSEGKLVISETFNSDKTLKLIEKLNNIFWNTDNGYYSDTADNQFLAEGYSLFYTTLGTNLATKLRNAEYEYLILPAPKYDEEQTNYVTAVGFPHSMYCIPTDIRDEDMAGAILECLASESYRQVTPVLFESAFKYKYAKGENDGIILDTIRNSVVFDLGRVFYDSLTGSGPVMAFRNQVRYNMETLTSTFQKLVKSYDADLAKILEKIKATS